jgi:hypothetical protein
MSLPKAAERVGHRPDDAVKQIVWTFDGSGRVEKIM